MSQSMPVKEGPALSDAVDEVRGVFASDAALQDAIARLTQVGFDRADLSLPDPLAPATPEQGAANPNTDTDDRQMRTMHASMAGSVGALAAAGVVIATGGAALPAVAAAAAAGLGAGALAHGAERAVDSSQHAAREQAAARGALMLAVRVTNAAKRGDAEAAMRTAGAERIDAVQRTDGATPPAPSR